MLHLMLGNAPNAFACGEAHSWFRPFKPQDYRFTCACGDPNCAVWSAFRRLSPSRFHASVARELGVEFVIDSSKELNWIVNSIRWARRSELLVEVILIWKDPVDLALSLWKRGRPDDLWHKMFVQYYGRFLSLGIPFHPVRFDRLISDGSGTLAEACRAVGMRALPGQKRFWTAEGHFLYGSEGIRSQVRSGQSELRPKEAYPSEFAARIPALKEEIRSNSRLVTILERLDRAPSGAGNPRQATSRSMKPRKPYPLWFYTTGLRYGLRRWRYRLTGVGHRTS